MNEKRIEVMENNLVRIKDNFAIIGLKSHWTKEHTTLYNKAMDDLKDIQDRIIQLQIDTKEIIDL